MWLATNFELGCFRFESNVSHSRLSTQMIPFRPASKGHRHPSLTWMQRPLPLFEISRRPELCSLQKWPTSRIGATILWKQPDLALFHEKRPLLNQLCLWSWFPKELLQPNYTLSYFCSFGLHTQSLSQPDGWIHSTGKWSFSHRNCSKFPEET